MISHPMYRLIKQDANSDWTLVVFLLILLSPLLLSKKALPQPLFNKYKHFLHFKSLLPLIFPFSTNTQLLQLVKAIFLISRVTIKTFCC